MTASTGGARAPGPAEGRTAFFTICSNNYMPYAKVLGATVRRHHPYFPGDKDRVVLSDTYDTADAMLVLPLPADAVDENNQPILEKTKHLRMKGATLITGKLAIELRNPEKRRLFRAIIHPYYLTQRQPQEQQEGAPPAPAA